MTTFAKKLFALPMNLQLFAGVNTDGLDPEDIDEDPAPGDPKPGDKGSQDPPDDDYGDDLEVDFGDDEDEDDLEDEEDEDIDNDDDDEEPADPPPADGKKQKDNPTANAVIAERKRLQEKHRKEIEALQAKAALADKVMKQSGATSIEELNQRMDFLETERLKKQGVDPQVAAAFVAQQREIEDMKATQRKLKYDGDVERLKKDAFFADIDDHRDELEELAERSGFTIEQVYRAVHGDRRLKEREAEIEARVKANRVKRDNKRVNTAPSAGASKKAGKSHNLTPEQLAAAKHGVKKGHFKSIEEYARLLR